LAEPTLVRCVGRCLFSERAAREVGVSLDRYQKPECERRAQCDNDLGQARVDELPLTCSLEEIHGGHVTADYRE
jgi:hypothetical protein